MKEKILEVFPGQGGKVYSHTPPECGLLEDSLKNHSALLKLHPGFKPDFVYGYSDGIYAAAVASGCLAGEEAMRLVKLRGDIVRETEAQSGIQTAMMTCLGIGRKEAASLAQEFGVNHSNDNGPALQILAGDVTKLQLIAQSGRIRKGIFLPIDSQFHVPAREADSKIYAQKLANLKLENPEIPIISSTRNEVLTSKEEVLNELIYQFVQFLSLPDRMALWEQVGIKTVIDIGPLTTSKKLITKINPGLEVLAFEEDRNLRLDKLAA